MVNGTPVGGQSRPGFPGGVIVTPSGQVVGSAGGLLRGSGGGGRRNAPIQAPDESDSAFAFRQRQASQARDASRRAEQQRDSERRQARESRLRSENLDSGFTTRPSNAIIGATTQENILQQSIAPSQNRTRTGITQFGFNIGELRGSLQGPTRAELITQRQENILGERFSGLNLEQAQQFQREGRGTLTPVASSPSGDIFSFQPSASAISEARTEARRQTPLLSSATFREASIGVGVGALDLADIGLGFAITGFGFTSLGRRDQEGNIRFTRTEDVGATFTSRIPGVNELRERELGLVGGSARIATSVVIPSSALLRSFSRTRASGLTRREAIGETLFSSSSIRPRSRTFEVTDDLFRTETFDIGVQGSRTSAQILRGRGVGSPETTIQGLQVTRSTGESSISQFVGTRRTPIVEFGPGGQLRFGTRTDVVTGLSRPRGDVFQGDILLASARGPRRSTISQFENFPRIQSFETQRSSVSLREFPGQIDLIGPTPSSFTTGVSGERSLGRITRGRVVTENLLGATQPSGSIRANEFGLITRIRLTRQTDSGFTNIRGVRPRGRRGTLLDQELSSPSISQNLGFQSQARTLTTTQTRSSTLLTGPDAFGALRTQRSLFEGTGQFERTSLIAPSRSRTTQSTINRDINLLSNNLLQTSRQTSSNRLGLALSQGTSQRQTQFSRQILGVSPTTTQSQRTLLFTGFEPSSPPITPRGFGRGGPLFSSFRLGNFPIGIPGFGFDERPPRTTRRRRRFTRQPSLIAVGLDIRSSRPVAGEISGLVTRPIITSNRRRRRR